MKSLSFLYSELEPEKKDPQSWLENSQSVATEGQWAIGSWFKVSRNSHSQNPDLVMV